MKFYENLEDPVTFKNQYCAEMNHQKRDKLIEWKKHWCECCQRELNGTMQWEEHIKTKKHKHLKAVQSKIKTKPASHRLGGTTLYLTGALWVASASLVIIGVLRHAMSQKI